MSRKRAKLDNPPMNAEAGRKANRTGRSIHVYVDPEIGDALQAFIDSHRLPPSMTSTIELALKSFLKAEGFWPKKL